MIEKVFRIEIQAGAQRVWQEITRTGMPHHAMFGTYLHCDLKPGSTMTYRDRSGKHTFVLGKVLESDPPRRLVHTFRFSMEKDDPTLVTWELKERAGATEVTITHARFAGETRTYKAVATSWQRILVLYKSLIETGRVPAGVRVKNGLMMGMTFMLPKGALTENALAMPLDAPAPSS